MGKKERIDFTEYFKGDLGEWVNYLMVNKKPKPEHIKALVSEITKRWNKEGQDFILVLAGIKKPASSIFKDAVFKKVFVTHINGEKGMCFELRDGIEIRMTKAQLKEAIKLLEC